MSARSRNRGAEYEREVCAQLAKALGCKITRNLGQARDGGDDITIGVFRVECKRRKALSVYEFVDQVVAAAKPGEVPLVIARADRRESLVILRLTDFLEMELMR